MHMADALLSPAVGATMWLASGAMVVHCAKKVREQKDTNKIPLMGVSAAFVFAAQMINFTIPGTGSSGHLGGGLILAMLLGPQAAFLAIASVLTVQCLFFADGGLLALGSNIFNLGFFPAFVAYPILRRIVGDRWGKGRVIAGSVVAGEIALLLGAFAVIVETALSGVSSLPFGAFSAMMLPIHAVIGLVEGIVTAAIASFVRQAQPEMLVRVAEGRSLAGLKMKRVALSLLLAAIVAGFGLSWFASSNPDGLEWSIAKVTGSEEFAAGTTSAIARAAQSVQEKTAIFPDYAARPSSDADAIEPVAATPSDAISSQGVIGALAVLIAAVLLGAVLHGRRTKGSERSEGTSR